jgi:hypothetical protein
MGTVELISAIRTICYTITKIAKGDAVTGLVNTLKHMWTRNLKAILEMAP